TAAVITFLFSVSNNIFTTTLLRSLYSFLFLFLMMFAFRWFVGLLLAWNKTNVSSLHEIEDSSGKGQTIDFITPDDESYSGSNERTPGSEGRSEEVAEEQKDQQDANDFSPLDPPKLTTKQGAPTEEMAKALRHLSEK